MQSATYDSCQHLKECAVFCWVHFSAIHHQVTLQIHHNICDTSVQNSITFHCTLH
jgi:hypothetical protein